MFSPDPLKSDQVSISALVDRLEERREDSELLSVVQLHII